MTEQANVMVWEPTLAEHAAIDELQFQCEIATRRSLVNNALTALQWIAEEVKRGRSIGSLDREKGVIEPCPLPVIEALMRSKTA